MADDNGGFIPATLVAHHPSRLVLSLEQCRDVIRFWADRLRLSDWVIEVAMDRGYDMGAALGSVTWSLTRKRASITVCDPQDHDPGRDPVDMEHVLVHELLHIHFAAWRDWSLEDEKRFESFANTICMEQPIECLSWVLLTMRRSNMELRGGVMSWEKP